MTLICGLLGLPPVNGVLPQAPMHTRACISILKHGGPDGKPGFVVREQRWTNLIQSSLCFVALFLTPVCKMIPRSVQARAHAGKDADTERARERERETRTHSLKQAHPHTRKQVHANTPAHSLPHRYLVHSITLAGWGAAPRATATPAPQQSPLESWCS